jgi:hypothetical protein
MKEKKEGHPFDKLSKPAQRALANADIKTLEQLSALTEKEYAASWHREKCPANPQNSYV